MNLTTDLSALLDSQRVLTRPLERYAFASDASFYHLVPQAVVRPANLPEIGSLFAYSRAQRIPLVFRAAGTSLSGQAITDGILVNLARDWGKLQVEADGALIRVQPGVIGARANRALKPYQRRIGPDPASIDAAMLGGILANNASGMCCGVSENSYHTLHSLTFMLPDGASYDSGAPDADALFEAQQPQLARGLLDIRQRILTSPALFERVRARYLTKNTTGYSLNAFIDYETPLAIMTHLLVGSEGTLAFIAGAVLHTLPDYARKHTGLLFFENVRAAGAAVPGLAASGARALEIMDRAAIHAIENLEGAPERLKGLPDGAAGLLVEYQCQTSQELEAFRATARRASAGLKLLEAPRFTEDPAEQAILWKLRKGMLPSAGATRQPGMSLINEDVAFPVPRLADAILDLRSLLQDYDYDNGIIFGHAKDGNLHFVIPQSFNEAASIQRYDEFMGDLAKLVVGRYDGALKAEHGTGRNMAPYVAYEWGQEAYGLMQELKALVDPHNLLNPGVILNPDPRATVAHLKSLPVIEAEVNACIECGFCEAGCPSRELTLTPRQRIVLRREMARLRAAPTAEALNELAALEAEYEYAGLDTCAVDGLCASACPVHINTGALVKRLRTEGASTRAQSLALAAERNFGVIENLVGGGVALGHVAGKLLGADFVSGVSRVLERPLGTRLPKWNAAVPYPSGRLPRGAVTEAQVVYFPSCLTRAMGGPPLDPSAPSLLEVLMKVSQRAGLAVSLPPESHGQCCGMPFGSKGYTAANRAMLHSTLARLWEWSQAGRLPVVIDASSCAYTLRACAPDLDAADLEIWRKLSILDPVEYARDWLLPRLKITPRPGRVVLHPNCALQKLGLAGALEQVTRACAETVVIPESLGCCGFAGDRGLLIPELTASATRQESQEVLAGQYDGYYSSNLTCEMGMALATGKKYRSFLYLLEEVSR